MNRKQKYYKTKATWPISEHELRERFYEYYAHIKWGNTFLILIFMILIPTIPALIYKDILPVSRSQKSLLFILSYIFLLIAFYKSITSYQGLFTSRYDLKCPACLASLRGVNSELLIQTHVCPKCGTQIVLDTKEYNEK